MTIAEFRSRLESHGCKPIGNGTIAARCPGHDDRRASLAVSSGGDGRVLLHCHAGCSPETIVGALGLKLGDLFPRSGRNGGNAIVAEYDYRDEQGTLLFQVVRLVPKDFRQRRPDGKGGWTWKTSGIRRVPFRLPELLKAIEQHLPVYITEGEKDVLALVKRGFAATCNPGGAGKWLADYNGHFNGAEVNVIADKDEPGRIHARSVAAALHGVAASVRVVEVPDVNGTPVKDAADFFAAGGEAADLDEMVRSSPFWLPRAEAPASDFEARTSAMRAEIIKLLMSKRPSATVRHDIAQLVVATLSQIGRFYFHVDLRDFDNAMFFDAYHKRLVRIRSDDFAAWLSAWVGINRAETHFRFIEAGVETAALSGALTTGIRPEMYWAARPGAIYISSGDGQVVKINPAGVAQVDNGTDDVLFASGKTLAPWQLVQPEDPFVTCSLFAQAHCDAEHGQDLLRLWLYSLPTNPRCKPPLCLSGDVGSGKTRTVKGLAELLGVPFVAQKVEHEGEPQFWPAVNAGGILCLDNADTRCSWLPDALANAATDGCSQRRRLYTDAEMVRLRAVAWIAVTTANPTFAADVGLADRLLLIRMGRREDETADSALSDEIVAHRNGALSHIANTLRGALANADPVPGGLNSRHPDFATFAVRIGRALGREAQAVAALRAAENDKGMFCLENDPVGSALIGLLRTSSFWTGTASDMLDRLKEIDPDLGLIRADGKPVWGAKRLGKRLSALWPHVVNAFPGSKMEKDRNGVSVFHLRGLRGFNEPFPINPL